MRGRISLRTIWYATTVRMPMNDTLMRSPNDDWSIQKTDQESITIKTSGTITSRTMKRDFRSTSMLTTKVEATPSLPAWGAG